MEIQDSSPTTGSPIAGAKPPKWEKIKQWLRILIDILEILVE